MDKIILAIKDKLYDGDLLIYKDGVLTPISRHDIVADVNKRVDKVEKEIAELNNKLLKMYNVIDIILKEQE